MLAHSTMWPRISIVTPSLNQGRYIEENILSFLAQEYADCEHIIVDGGSTDETLKVLERYPHLRWVSEPDRGQTEAINKGIRMSTGQVFAFLNADDVYRPEAFRAVSEVFHDDPTTAVLVGDCDVIDERSQLQGHYRARLDHFGDMLRYWQWGHSFCIPQAAVFLRRKLFDELGLFDESYDLAMDYEMWLRVATRYPFTVVHDTLAAFRVTDETKTQRRRREMDREQFRASRKYWRWARGVERWRIACGVMARGVLHLGARDRGDR